MDGRSCEGAVRRSGEDMVRDEEATSCTRKVRLTSVKTSEEGRGERLEFL